MKKRSLILLLVFTLIVSLVSCGKKNDTLVISGTDLKDATSLKLLTLDRNGEVVFNAIKGETRSFNNKDYTYFGPADFSVSKTESGMDIEIKLGDDLKFSDGEIITIDDVIFSMYVMLDPGYKEENSFKTLNIKGLDEYISGYDRLYNYILKNGIENDDFSIYTFEEQNEFFNEGITNAGLKFVDGIVSYVIGNYGDAYSLDKEDIKTIAKLWNYELEDDATTLDFWNALLKKYDDIFLLSNVERGTTLIEDCFDSKWQVCISEGDTLDYISGIKKVNNNTVIISLNEVDATWYTKFDLNILPLHHYGDDSLYNYDLNCFGFNKGDLSKFENETHLGAGAYKYEYDDKGEFKIVANSYYYLGEPKVKYLQLAESNDIINSVANGNIYASSLDNASDILSALEVGDSIETQLYDYLGFGYIGMNANVMSVGSRNSDKSTSLRKAFNEVFSKYIDEAISEYFGVTANRITNPIISSSWVKLEERNSAESDILSLLSDAGFKVEEGKVVAAPANLTLTFNAYYVGEGSGNHPAKLIFEKAKEFFDGIGIELIITDLSSGTELWEKLKDQEIMIWASALSSDIDPDLYSIYFSGNGDTHAGNIQYQFMVDDSKLNSLILSGRNELDFSERRNIYKEAFDIIYDWQVVLPLYQRKNAYIFNSSKVDITTIASDLTPFYSWIREIEKIELL